MHACMKKCVMYRYGLARLHPLLAHAMRLRGGEQRHSNGDAAGHALPGGDPHHQGLPAQAADQGQQAHAWRHAPARGQVTPLQASRATPPAHTSHTIYRISHADGLSYEYLIGNLFMN